MSLQEKLSAFKTQFQSGKPPFEGVPASVHAVMQRATDELVASGASQRVRRSGMAPPFELMSVDGARVRLADLTARGAVVLSFYRGVWCPYCNLDVRELESYADRIRSTGASLVAITPQTAANSRKLIADHNVSFPVLHDPGNVVANQFGLLYQLPDYLIELYKQLGVDLSAFNDDGSWTLPVPARFVVDRDGNIRYAEANPDYTRRPEPEELLPVLMRLQSAVAA